MKSENRRERLRTGEEEKEMDRGVCRPNIGMTAAGGGPLGFPSRENLVRPTSYQRGARTHAHAGKASKGLGASAGRILGRPNDEAIRRGRESRDIVPGRRGRVGTSSDGSL